MDKMEKSYKVTTHDDQSELTTECGEDDYSRKLSPEELKVKIRMFRNLCLDKKINASNAFDIDMIGYFKTWLAESRNQSSEDISSFIEIADYLDASGTVYSYRVDNLSETTSQLVEKFRVINYKKELDDDEVDEPVKTHKPKRTKLMLTTAEKLHNKSMDSDIINPSIQGIPNLDYKEMYTHTSPADYMMSLFGNTTLEDDLKKYNDDKENKNYGVIQIRNLEDELTKKVICPDFHEFVAERDREDNYEISPLECIEDRFDPNDHHYSNMTINSISNVFNGYEDRTENNPSLKDNDQSAIGGLLECIDGVDRDYSFFNPQLLANWKGPKAWKAQAMVKALKSCNPSERRDLMPISDDFNEEEVVKPKEIKKRNKVENKKVKIEWMKMDSIHKILEEKVQGKEKVLPRLLQKWNAFDNIGDARTIGVDIVYNFENLKYLETYPDWWKQKKNKNTKISAEEIIPGPSPKHQDINDCDEVIETAETEYNDKTADDIDEFENNEPENEDCEQAASCDHNESEESHSSNDIFKEIKTEAKMDIGVLKKEILEIINQECVDIDDNSNWSSQLPFENLLCKLKVNEREGLSVSIAFVALLHLTNEKGLKLSQEYSGDINNMKSIYISKPLGKN